MADCHRFGDRYRRRGLALTAAESGGRSAENPNSPVDIEITSNPVSATEHPALISLGITIELPLLLIVHSDELLVIGSVLLLVASIYSVFFPEVYGLWTGILRPELDRKDRELLETAHASGKELTPRQRARLMRLLAESDVLPS